MKILPLFVMTVSTAGAMIAATPTPPGPHALGHRRPAGPHHPPPLILALDSNHDSIISADEIANAPAALRTLDKNGDGTLSLDELRPPRPADAPPLMPPDGRHRPPLMLALDANADGELSPAEIANAPTSLKALDANQDGQLTFDELRPLPPE